MAMIERVKNICLTPSTEWSVIEGESTPPGALLGGYAAPLAAIGAVAGFIGGSVLGRTIPFIGTYRVPLATGLVVAVFTLVMAVVGVAILSVIINALAPTFGGQQNFGQAVKLAVYSYTPAWVAGVLQILPLLGILAILGALYGLYVMYVGMARLMKCPQEKALGYTAVVVVCAIVLSIVVTSVGAVIGGAALIGSGQLASAIGARSGTPSSAADADVQFDKNSPLGKLQELGKKLDESNKKIEAAQKAGDQAGQAAAAFEGLGTLLGGGKRVEPMSIDELKPFVPDTFAGLAKTASSAEKNGIAGLMVSKAEATYGEGDKAATLEISDTGGISGMMALASWVNVQDEKEDDNGFERTQRQGGRIVHERGSKNGGTNEYGIVVGDRFMVSAKSRSLDVNQLKAAVGSLNLAKLESMKDTGVQK